MTTRPVSRTDPIVELLRQAAEITGGKWPEHLPKQRLADASLLLPELGEPEAEPPLPLEGPGGQVRLLEGVAGVIAAACEGPKPGVVFVDDVHAADRGDTRRDRLPRTEAARPVAASDDCMAQRGRAARASPAPRWPPTWRATGGRPS